MIHHPNLKLWTPFNEGSTSTAYDKSASGYNGTITGLSVVDGVIGKGVQASASTNRINFGNVLNFTYGQPFTISLFFKCSALPWDGQIISKMLGASPWTGWGIWMANPGHSYGDGTIVIDIVNTAAIAHKSGYTVSSFSNNVLHHLMVTYDGSNSTFNTAIKVYVDGQLQAMTIVYDTSISGGFSNTATLQVSNRYNLNYSFAGLVDEVQIYNTALPASDAKRLALNLHPLGRS